MNIYSQDYWYINLVFNKAIQSIPTTPQAVHSPSQTRPVTPVPTRRVYKVPSLVKRLLAEGIDSICIQLIKLLIGVLIINQTDLMYDLFNLLVLKKRIIFFKLNIFKGWRIFEANRHCRGAIKRWRRI